MYRCLNWGVVAAVCVTFGLSGCKSCHHKSEPCCGPNRGAAPGPYPGPLPPSVPSGGIAAPPPPVPAGPPPGVSRYAPPGTYYYQPSWGAPAYPGTRLAVPEAAGPAPQESARLQPPSASIPSERMPVGPAKPDLATDKASPSLPVDIPQF